MDSEAADRIARAAYDNPDSRTARTDWPGRARGAADRNETAADEDSSTGGSTD